MIKDAISVYQKDLEIDNNGFRTQGVVVEVVHFSKNRSYSVLFYYNCKKYKAWCINNEYCRNCKKGDTIDILVSTINPMNIRCDK
jgi:hypothetical protein